ncbi:MAG: GerMN domain-containing protein [Bacilli bacterium]|nr:GerMN domain-containing protein [Bacilli bacterium]
MIKRFSIKQIGKYTILLLVVFLFCLFPEKESYTLDKKVNKEISINYHDIFLIDKNGYISKTNIQISKKKKGDIIDELIETLTINGKYQDKIPNGFNAILPVDTKLLDKQIDDNILTLNFSKELLETKKELEEKVIESIIYTMTSVEGIDYIKIKIEGNLLTKLPKSGKLLDETLDRNFGINKMYNIDKIKNVKKVIIYYSNKTNEDNTYYIPVTKYINSDEDKIKIIIDELTSKISYESNLMSYLNYNAKLLDYSFNEDELDLNFNEYLFDSEDNKKVLEEVIYSISYSIMDNYEVSKINFYVNNEEI